MLDFIVVRRPTRHNGALPGRSVHCLRWFARLAMILCAAAYVSTTGGTALASESEAASDLHTMDHRVLAVSHRLATSSAHRCPTTMPALGLTMHSRDQYSQASPQWIKALFPDQGQLAIQALLPDGPASVSGVPASATILSIGEWEANRAQSSVGQIRLQAHNYLMQLPLGQPIPLTWTLGGESVTSSIEPVAACRVLFEVAASSKRFAHSSGPIIQISSRFVGMLNDDQLAVVLSHELAHSALEHRKQLAGQNVGNGIFAEFGRSGRLKREAEIEADRISLYILRDAGYDPDIAPSFWRSKIGKKSSGGIFRNRAYPSAKKRAKLMEDEVARIGNSIAR